MKIINHWQEIIKIGNAINNFFSKIFFHPLIVSDVGGNKEIIQDNRNGFLLKELHPSQIAEKINFLENYPEKKNIRLNGVSSSLNYSVVNMVNNYMDLYSEVVY